MSWNKVRAVAGLAFGCLVLSCILRASAKTGDPRRELFDAMVAMLRDMQELSWSYDQDEATGDAVLIASTQAHGDFVISVAWNFQKRRVVVQPIGELMFVIEEDYGADRRERLVQGTKMWAQGKLLELITNTRGASDSAWKVAARA